MSDYKRLTLNELHEALADVAGDIGAIDDTIAELQATPAELDPADVDPGDPAALADWLNSSPADNGRAIFRARKLRAALTHRQGEISRELESRRKAAAYAAVRDHLAEHADVLSAAALVLKEHGAMTRKLAVRSWLDWRAGAAELEAAVTRAISR